MSFTSNKQEKLFKKNVENLILAISMLTGETQSRKER